MGCDQIKKVSSEIQVMVAGNSYQEEYVILLVKLRPQAQQLAPLLLLPTQLQATTLGRGSLYSKWNERLRINKSGIFRGTMISALGFIFYKLRNAMGRKTPNSFSHWNRPGCAYSEHSQQAETSCLQPPFCSGHCLSAGCSRVHPRGWLARSWAELSEWACSHHRL